MSTVAAPLIAAVAAAASTASSAAASAAGAPASTKPDAPQPPSSSSGIPGNLSDSEVEELVATRLQNFVKGTSAPFTCGGSVTLDSPPSITLLGDDDDDKDDDGTSTKSEGGKTSSVIIQPPKELRDGKLSSYEYAKDSYRTGAKEKRAELFEQQEADFSDLLGVMPQAPFGKGKETVYDPSIRDALQLKAEKFELTIPQEKLDGILAEIKKGLDLETDVIAERYSLNAYRKGGKFARHKDTPRGDDMLGTLVICLPSWFTGGKMTVSLGEETKEYFGNPSKYSWQQKDPPKPRIVQWCAFFSDVDHEIHMVEEGIRLTVAYLLRRRDKASASSNLPKRIAGQEQADRIKDGLLGGLRDERFLTSGGKIGFPCLHLYTNTEVFPGKKDSSQALTPAQIAKLKGRDILIANAATAAGLAVRLVPYLGHDYSLDGEGDYPLHKFPNKKRPPRRMDDDKIQSFFKTDEPAYPDSAADLWILDFNSAAQSKAGETEWNADGYFGNEASWISFYVKACLIIEVPPHSASRGVPVQPLPPKKKRKTAPRLSVDTSGAALASSSATRVITPPSSSTYDLKAQVLAELASLRSMGTKTTADDVEKLCTDKAVALASLLANELNRTSGSTSSAAALSGQKRPAAAASSELISSQSTTPKPAAKKKFDATAVKKRLLKRTTTEVKKTAHNDKKKPYSTVSDAVPDEDAARQLFESITPTSDTKAMIKWKLTGMDVSRWFKDDPNAIELYIHPVKFDGKVIALFGTKPKVYAWAAFESVEAKYEKKTNLLSLKVRTYMAGTGRPDMYGVEDLPVPPRPNRNYMY